MSVSLTLFCPKHTVPPAPPTAASPQLHCRAALALPTGVTLAVQPLPTSLPTSSPCFIVSISSGLVGGMGTIICPWP